MECLELPSCGTFPTSASAYYWGLTIDGKTVDETDIKIPRGPASLGHQTGVAGAIS